MAGAPAVCRLQGLNAAFQEASGPLRYSGWAGTETSEGSKANAVRDSRNPLIYLDFNTRG